MSAYEICRSHGWILENCDGCSRAIEAGRARFVLKTATKIALAHSSDAEFFRIAIHRAKSMATVAEEEGVASWRLRHTEKRERPC